MSSTEQVDKAAQYSRGKERGGDALLQRIALIDVSVAGAVLGWLAQVVSSAAGAAGASGIQYSSADEWASARRQARC